MTSGGIMERKLMKCGVCQEWFNTTNEIMIEHYRTRHEPLFKKTMAIAELVVKRNLYLAQSRVTPFPLNIQCHVAAALTNDQLQRVISERAVTGNQLQWVVSEQV